MGGKPRGRPRTGAGGRSRGDLIAAVGELLNDLAALDYEPTLVGGMALVTLGSSRVTRDFDFLVVEEARAHNELIEVFYRRGFELASATDEQGNIIRTIDSGRVAAARLRIDRPNSAYFHNRALGLRVDLLFDFPISAREVQDRSTRKKVASYTLRIACIDDLIRMKEIAVEERRNAADQQDLEFLKSVEKRSRRSRG